MKIFLSVICLLLFSLSNNIFAADESVIAGWFGVACDLSGKSEAERDRAIASIVNDKGNNESYFIEKLGSEQTIERQLGAKILGEVGGVRAERELILALKDQDVFLQGAAARALARYYTLNKQEFLLKRLQGSPEYMVRMAALYGAYNKARYNNEEPQNEVVDKVVDILRSSKDDSEIIAAIMVLRYANTQEAVLGLLNAVDSNSNMLVQIEVCKALAAIAPAGEAKVIEELAVCGVPEIEVEALAALAAMGYKDTSKALLVLATYPSAIVQARAIEVLAGTVSRSYADVFIAALKSKDAIVRLAALQALEKLGATEAAGKISEMMGSSGDRDPLVRAYAALVFNRLTRSGGLTPLLAEARSNDVNKLAYKIEAIKVLGLLRDKGALRVLLELLDDGEYEVRMVAIESLGELQDKRAIGKVQRKILKAQGDELLALTELLEKLR